MSPQSAARPDVPILVVCASRDRPESLRQMVKTFCETSEMADLAVYVDADQIHLYMHHCDWKAEFGDRLMFTIDRQLGPNGSINALYQKHRSNYRIFGVCPDDSRFKVKGWDRFVVSEMEKFPGRIGVVSPAHNDGHYCAYPYVSREWVEIVGWYAYPEAHSFVWDTCVEMLGEATNIVYAEEAQFRMHHECKKSENFEKYLKLDEHAFLAWCVVHRRDLVKKLRSAMWSATHPSGIIPEELRT